MAVNDAAAMPHMAEFFKTLAPMRQAANNTMATTAGLTAHSTPAITGVVP